MNDEQKREVTRQVEAISQAFQDSYGSDMALLERRDKAHVARIRELEAELAQRDEWEEASPTDYDIHVMGELPDNMKLMRRKEDEQRPTP